MARGGNMEGQEVRLGPVAGATWSAITTATSNGSVNSMHDSFQPLGGVVPMSLMMLNVDFSGIGAGFLNMLMYVITAVFLAGLMVGRTPEYLGKKVEAREMKLAMLALLVHPILVLGPTGLFAAKDWGAKATNNPGAHGFSEVLYAFSSAGNNNGSAFAGLSANTPFYNTALGLAMLFARYWLAVPALAIAGSLAAKKSVPQSAGTFPTTGGLFVGLVVGVIVIVGGLTFFPALALGPLVEHLAQIAGTTFAAN